MLIIELYAPGYQFDGEVRVISDKEREHRVAIMPDISIGSLSESDVPTAPTYDIMRFCWKGRLHWLSPADAKHYGYRWIQIWEEI